MVVKNIFDNIKTSKNLPFFIMGVFMFVFYIAATNKFADDAHFMATNPLQNGIIFLINNVYQTWTSRIFIYPTMVALSLAPIWIWRILDMAVWLILAISISKLVAKKNDIGANWFLVALMMLYPYWQMSSAGWISTTTNFSWPLAFGMFAFLTLKRIWEGNRLPIYRWILAVMAFLYATDAEQMLMIQAAVFSVLLVHLIWKHKTSSLPRSYKNTVVFGFIFLVLRAIFTFTAPGNQVRSIVELRWFPGYEYLSFMQRLLLGFEVTITRYMVFTLALFPLFAIILMYIIWKKHKSISLRIISMIPLLTCLVINIVVGVNAIMSIRGILPVDDESGFIVRTHTMIQGQPGILILYVLFLICLMISIYKACDKPYDGLWLTGIMMVGFASQVVLGFSPTIYASSFRTFIYAIFAIIICLLYLYENNDIKLPARGMRIIKTLFILACAVNYGITLLLST